MRHAGRLHKIYWDAQHPDPVVFPFQDAWYVTYDEYLRRNLQPIQSSQPVANDNLQPITQTPPTIESELVPNDAIPCCQEPSDQPVKRPYLDQLRCLHDEISLFHKITLQQRMNEILEGLSPLQELAISASSYVRLESLPQMIATVCVSSEEEEDAFSWDHAERLQAYLENGKAAHSPETWVILDKALSACLLRIRKRVDTLSGIRLACYHLVEDTKHDAPAKAKDIAGDLCEQALLFAVRIKVIQNKFPYRWSEVAPSGILSQPYAEWAPLFGAAEDQRYDKTEVVSFERINAPVAFIPCGNKGAKQNPPIHPWESEIYAEADAYADEVRRKAQRSFGASDEHMTMGFFRTFEKAKKEYLKKYHGIEWFTSEECHPGWIFD